MALDEQTYVHAASETLRQLLDALDAFQDEFEAELSNDILTLEFRDGERCVINSHRAARQIWLAAERRAWHFDYQSENHWQATKTGEDLWQVVETLVCKHLGRAVELRGSKGT